MSSTLVEQFAVTSGRHASKAVYHVHSWRPWMSMYGLRLRPRGAAQSEVDLGSRLSFLWSSQCRAHHTELDTGTQVPQAPIQKLLPPELTTTVLRYLPITTLAHCQCVCKQWNALGNFPPLWQSACQEAFQYIEYDKLSRLVRTAHK